MHKLYCLHEFNLLSKLKQVLPKHMNGPMFTVILCNTLRWRRENCILFFMCFMLNYLVQNNSLGSNL